MRTTKVRKTLSLDADIVEMLAADGNDNISAAVNEILRAEATRREYQAGLERTCERLEALYGPPDPKLVEEYMIALS